MGLGNDKSQTLPCVVETLQNKTVVSVSCGMHHTAALLDTGDMYVVMMIMIMMMMMTMMIMLRMVVVVVVITVRVTLHSHVPVGRW